MTGEKTALLPRKKILQCACLAAGLLILLGSWQILHAPEKQAHKIEKYLGSTGRWLTTIRTDILFYGVAPGLILLAAGSLITAFSIRTSGSETRSRTVSSGSAMNSSEHPLPLRHWKLFLSGTLVALILPPAFYIYLHKHNAAAILIFAASISVGGWLYHLLDAGAGVRFRLWCFTRGETLAVCTVMLVIAILLGHDAGHWRWSGTPDESHFFMMAKSISFNGLPDRFILSEKGVFDYHPVLSSLYQALVMKGLGINAWGWKLSSVLALIAALPFLYLFVREFWNRETALIAMVFLGISRLSITFSHHGYNNIQIVPVTCITLAILARAIHQKSLMGWYCSGVAAGFGFYTYYPARLALLLAVILAACLIPLKKLARSKKFLTAWIAGLLLTMLPLLTHPERMLANMLQQTQVTGGAQIKESEVTSFVSRFMKSGQNLKKTGDAMFLSIIHSVFYRYPSHFNIEPVSDEVSSTLMFIGLSGAFLTARRSRIHRFLLIAFFLSCLIAGSISPYDRPPLTRLLFLTPLESVFAAVAVHLLIENGPCIPVRFFRRLAAWTIVLASAGLSYQAIHRQIYIEKNGYGKGTTSELVRVSRSLPVNWKIVFIQRKDTFMDCVDLVMDEYNMGSRVLYLRPFNDRARERLLELKPPFAVFCDLEKPLVSEVIRCLNEHYHSIRAGSTSPWKEWNLNFIYVTE